MMDLLGADLPVEGGAPGEFAWSDGPLLRALRSGAWVLLDELNLAGQSVLEGLNAVLDHRAEARAEAVTLGGQARGASMPTCSRCLLPLQQCAGQARLVAYPQLQLTPCPLRHQPPPHTHTPTPTQVFIPELGSTFRCPPSFRIFGAQNPLQEGGGRKGLPRSFLNRFTRVHVELLRPEDLRFIAGGCLSGCPEWRP